MEDQRTLLEDVERSHSMLHDPSVWRQRYRQVEELQFDLGKELDIVGELVEENARNYLLWHYRRSIAKKLGTSVAWKELEFTKQILSRDAQNYCAWSHRQWIFRALGGNGEDELHFSHEILTKDIFNSFAWDQRWFVMSTMQHWPCMEVTERRYSYLKVSEAKYALKAIQIEPGNASPWTYIELLYQDNLDHLFVRGLFFGGPYLEFLKDQAVCRKELSKVVDPRDYMNRKGCQYALRLFSEVLARVGEPFGCKEVIEDLFPGWFSDSEFNKMKFDSFEEKFDAYWDKMLYANSLV